MKKPIKFNCYQDFINAFGDEVNSDSFFCDDDWNLQGDCAIFIEKNHPELIYGQTGFLLKTKGGEWWFVPNPDENWELFLVSKKDLHLCLPITKN